MTSPWLSRSEPLNSGAPPLTVQRQLLNGPAVRRSSHTAITNTAPQPSQSTSNGVNWTTNCGKWTILSVHGGRCIRCTSRLNPVSSCRTDVEWCGLPRGQGCAKRPTPSVAEGYSPNTWQYCAAKRPRCTKPQRLATAATVTDCGSASRSVECTRFRRSCRR
ncbi:MAG: hypothetical protein QOH57_4506 [Mycobacterium sp.]|nr:hypothetical protein [Mycobacterium sp.]